MLFKRAVQRYGRTPPPETPYARAGKVWDDRIGSARAQASNWRFMAIASLGLAGGLAGTLAWQATQSRVVPYVVEVDALGEARAVRPADVEYRPGDPQIAWHLGRFITNIRSVSLDPVLMRRGWLEAYDFATKRGAVFLGDYARGANPFGKIGEKTVSVTITSVVRASDQSFQVKWVETAYERGSEASSSRWTAILTVVTKPPATADVLRRNPLGIYVDAIDWSRELETSLPQPRRPVVPPANIPSGSPLDPTLAETPPHIPQEFGA
ncbi:conjugal transfer protein TrbF [Rhizorhabdus dicambivorans]|uniref:Conjugal transfer protein TrbF n=1 Tax=Rhizorhabdus dicambivorans TaxID=1850238 RepID=A0A2A4FRP0_9SPHN|nr:conjugal transfer protein TrbF [Rhizorhabdus dicambivorans]ATE66368.1 conjugal transfer protein TrbF [Rhizorhabdus dicambivorans]PCE40390.1 conjugal transfer protein TrbF [Rhizorhabdus dicambivorans]